MTPRPTRIAAVASPLTTSPLRMPGRSRRQGSLLVLVVVCLVLMALLGTAYLQVARVDRFATADFHQNDIDQVANATINYIGKVLRDDLVNKDGGFFSQDKGGTALQITATYDDGYADEPYDYPWTNDSYIGKWAVKDDTGNVVAADGGLYDDTWLASNVPTFTGAAPDSSWAHISNLMGTFLQIPTTGGPATPTELPSKVTGGTWNHDTAVTTAELVTAAANYLPLGTDTDMDGVPDAKWQWAPLRQIGSKKYVMAVRIIDNSAMLNLNTATSGTADGDSVTSARGYFPSEIDLSRITKRMPSVRPTAGAGPYWYDELANNNTAPDESLFARRGVSTATLTPLGSASVTGTGAVTWVAGTTSRAGAWLETSRLWGNSTNKLALANEMELRRLAGVNNDNVTTSIEDAMPVMLRRDHTELTFLDVASYGGYPGGLTGNQQVVAYFLGVNTSDASNPYSAINARAFPSLRNQFTTQSSAALYASNAGGVNPIVSTQSQRTLKYDLVHGDGGSIVSNNPARIDAIYAVLRRIFRVSDTGSFANSGGTTAYLGVDKSIVAERNALSDIAYEYALALQDYSDADRLPSSSVSAGSTVLGVTPSVPGRTYYGLETLPFFREGYVQAAYQNKDFRDGVGAMTPDGIPDTFVYDPTTAAIAFEIGNPFDRTIDFDAAAPNPAIRVKVGNNLYPLTGTLNSRQTRIFYANTLVANRKAEGPEAILRGDLTVDLSLTPGPGVVALTDGPTFAAGSRIVFELQFESTGGAWVTYDRLTPDLPISPTPITPANTIMYVASNYHNDLAALPGDLDLYHYELFSMIRPVSNAGTPGPYYISNENKEFIPFPATSNRPAFLANSDQLGNPAKLNGGGGPLNGNPLLTDYQLPSANRQFLSVAELGWIHMFGFYSSANAVDNELGDFPTRMRDLAPNRRRLVLNDPAGPNHATMRMPHAALLFDQFTTLSPRNDGLDNDNDGTVDNEAEQSVRGQININTAPLHLLTLAAPLNETVAEIQALMQSIMHYRDYPGDRAAMSSVAPTVTRNNAPGFASIGELLLLDNPAYDSSVTSPTLLPVANMTNPTGRMDGYASASFTGSNVDLYPMPEQVSATVVQHNINAADNEAKLARFQFLSQVFNTRSDTFTAYVRLRGYPSQDFSNGEIESRSFLVVYDRSNIVSASDMPRIVGVYVYNVP